MGTGSYGTIYLGTDLKTGEEVGSHAAQNQSSRFGVEVQGVQDVVRRSGLTCRSSGQVAVKTEKDLGQKYSPLRSEAETLIDLQGANGVPDVFWLGKRELGGEVAFLLLDLGRGVQDSF
jgi:hypothetical protein